jgi:hypothetical protein
MQDSKSNATESSSASLLIMSAISSLKFPFKLTKDQIEAVDAWTTNGYRCFLLAHISYRPSLFCGIESDDSRPNLFLALLTDSQNLIMKAGVEVVVVQIPLLQAQHFAN